MIGISAIDNRDPHIIFLLYASFSLKGTAGISGWSLSLVNCCRWIARTSSLSLSSSGSTVFILHFSFFLVLVVCVDTATGWLNPQNWFWWLLPQICWSHLFYFTFLLLFISLLRFSVLRSVDFCDPCVNSLLYSHVPLAWWCDCCFPEKFLVTWLHQDFLIIFKIALVPPWEDADDLSHCWIEGFTILCTALSILGGFLSSFSLLSSFLGFANSLVPFDPFPGSSF